MLSLFTSFVRNETAERNRYKRRAEFRCWSDHSTGIVYYTSFILASVHLFLPQMSFYSIVSDDFCCFMCLMQGYFSGIKKKKQARAELCQICSSFESFASNIYTLTGGWLIQL